jgi:hypothetical protein
MPEHSTRNRSTAQTSSTDTGLTPGDEFDQELGNADRQELLKVTGSLGRAFNRIAGVSESNTDPTGLAFKESDLKTYLEEQLKFAQGEFFRSAKIGGVADKIMETLDADRDGRVDWIEFQTMVEEMKTYMIGELGPGAGSSEIQTKANELFAEVSGGEESVSFDRLQAATEEQLPEDTDHKSLVSQLAALMVIDIVDIDEAEKEVRDRTVSHSEWMGAVSDFTSE